MSFSIPIFIITHDRLDVLKTSFESFKKINSKINYEIVLCDNKSTYKPLIEWLKTQEKQGYKVYWNDTKHLFEGIQKSVNKWYENNDSPYYIVSDPDIELTCPSDILEYYIYLFEKFPKTQIVAPLLRTDDIPDHYPAKRMVLRNLHNNFGKQKRIEVEWKTEKQKIIYAGVGCTFAMYRKGFVKKKDTSNNCPVISIRTEFPYVARHLDWYIDPNNMTEDQIRYCKKQEQHTHWGTKHIRKYVK